MSRLKRILLILLVVFLIIAVLFVVFVGPWPTYADSDYANSDYYKAAIARIESEAAQNNITMTPGRLRAGWAEEDITPETGVPLGGYGARGPSHRSTGVRDRLYVKALALNDGVDTAILVGADMLITPPNIAELVREKVAARTDLTAADILFNASHTHCGPGGFGPGFAARMTGGKFVPELPEFLAQRYADAIVRAYEGLEPAKLANGSVDAPQYIRNRTRDAAVDPELSFLLVEQEDGDQCYLASYSAHPTIFGARQMQFSAEYPGELMGFIKAQTGGAAHYLGGAVGSMGPRAPEAPGEGLAQQDARVRLMGQALAQLVLDNSQELQFRDNLDVAAVGLPIGLPEAQVRPSSPNWRVSPILPKLLGFPQGGWIHSVRVGDLFFIGLPCDFSGEISVEWKAWAQRQGLDLWTLSFCGTYCGYFSPDRYYRTEELKYEMGAMNWYGPNIEAYMTDLFHKMVDVMYRAS